MNKKDIKFELGKPAPDLVLHAKKKKVAEEEATKEEVSKKDVGEQAAEPAVQPQPQQDQAQPEQAEMPKEKEEIKPSPVEAPTSVFDLNEVCRGRDRQKYIFVFFYRDNSDFEDREEMWSIRDSWDQLQQIGRGLDVFGFSTKEKTPRIDYLKRKLKLPFEIYSDTTYDAFRQWFQLPTSMKYLGAFMGKNNCGVLLLGDKTVVRSYLDHWSVEQLMGDMKEIEQRMAEGKPPVEPLPSKEKTGKEKEKEKEKEEVPATTEGTATTETAKDETVNSNNNAVEEDAMAKEKEKEKDKKKKKEKEGKHKKEKESEEKPPSEDTGTSTAAKRRTISFAGGFWKPKKDKAPKESAPTTQDAAPVAADESSAPSTVTADSGPTQQPEQPQAQPEVTDQGTSTSVAPAQTVPDNSQQEQQQQQ